MFSSEQRGSLYAILSGFLYGFIGYFGMSVIHENMSASNMLAWRFLLASLVILIMLIPQLRNIQDGANKMLIAFVTGAFFYGISTLLYFVASGYIGSGLAMVIFFSYPVFIMVFNNYFSAQPIPKIYYFAIAIILIGMVLMINLSQLAFDLIGILFAIASSFFYAAYIIASKNNRISPLVSTLMVSLGCMMISFFIAFCTNTLVIPKSSSIWLNLLGIGVIATAIPILLMLHSLNFISSVKASILSVLEPVFVVILGVLLLGEKLNFWNAIGIVFVLGGALITLFSSEISPSKKQKLEKV